MDWILFFEESRESKISFLHFAGYTQVTCFCCTFIGDVDLLQHIQFLGHILVVLIKTVCIPICLSAMLLYLLLAASPLASSGFAAIGDWKGLCPFQTSIS